MKKNIDQKSFIEKIEIKKIFPDKLVIKVFEKEPIAILIDKNQKKYYMGKKIDLIEYRKIFKYENLPIVKGEAKNFKKLFDNLIKINFPTDQIIKYQYFKVNRWNIEMIDKKILKSLVLKGNNVFCNVVYTGKKIRIYEKQILKYADKSKYFFGTSLNKFIL